MIADSDEAIREGRESPDDPVAVRAVTDALLSKGQALSALRRFEESLLVWDELLARPIPARTRFGIASRRFWELAHNPADVRIPDAVDEVVELFDELGRPSRDAASVADALARKSYALERLGRRDEAARVDADLLDAFGGDPQAAAEVSATLANTIRRMLKSPEHLEAALITSEQLRGRLATEPEETLPQLADAVVRGIQLLTGIAEPTLMGTALALATSVVNSGAEGWRKGQSFLNRRVPNLAALLPGPGALEEHANRIDTVNRGRRRLLQALAMCESLIERIGGSEDAELRRSAATASIYRGVTLTFLGHIRDGFRSFDLDAARMEPGTGAAYQQIANTAKSPGWLRGFGVASLLSLKAAALGGDDAGITRLAYDESVNALPAEISEGRWTTIVIRLLRPRGKVSVVVPDYPPKASK